MLDLTSIRPPVDNRLTGDRLVTLVAWGGVLDGLSMSIVVRPTGHLPRVAAVPVSRHLWDFIDCLPPKKYTSFGEASISEDFFRLDLRIKFVYRGGSDVYKPEFGVAFDPSVTDKSLDLAFGRYLAAFSRDFA